MKAFDKSDHGVILSRCREKGIMGKVGIWLHNYLLGRQQAVIANNKISSIKEVISGVPQGSVIGPLLFLILIDSISESSLDAFIGTFADDTRVSRTIIDENDAAMLQEDIVSLQSWADSNNMAFNGSKFQCLKYGSREAIKNEYFYGSGNFDNVIEDVTSTRDLGIIMSSSSDFTEQVNQIVKRAKKKSRMDS